MADVEKPINEYDFANGDVPDEEREEEKYLYEYFKLRGPKENKTKKYDSDFDIEEQDRMEGESVDTDPELEDFAEKIIAKEMKRLGGGIDPDDEDLDEEDYEALEEELGDIDDNME